MTTAIFRATVVAIVGVYVLPAAVARAQGARPPTFSPECTAILGALPKKWADVPALLARTDAHGKKKAGASSARACREALQRWSSWWVTSQRDAVRSRPTVADLERVAAAHESYLAAFPDADDRGDIYRGLAAIRWRLVELEETGPGRAGPSSPSGAPTPLSAAEKSMVAAFDDYLSVAGPADPERPMIIFLKARTLWRHDQLTEAIPLLKSLVGAHLESEVGERSVDLLLDGLVRLGDTAELERVVDGIRGQQKFVRAHPELAKKLQIIAGQLARKKAEGLEMAGKYDECGAAYLALHRTAPDAEHGDEILYNAGVCFEMGRSIGLAIRAFEEMMTRYPKSPHTRKAMVRAASLHSSLGLAASLARAAQLYERYATLYAGEKDAPSALSNAITYRLALDEMDRARRDAQLFARNYGRRIRDDAASIQLGLAARWADRGDAREAVKMLRAYLAEFGIAGGADRALIANARIGKLLWAQSCPVRGSHGVCVKAARQRRPAAAGLPVRCGPASIARVEVVPRSTRGADQARTFLRSAVKLGTRLDRNTDPARRASAAYWLAAAEFWLIEADFEKFLSVPFPDGLDFDPKRPAEAAESQRRFLDWLKEQQSRAADLTRRYQAIADRRGGGQEWAVAASARVGQIVHSFADTLRTAEIPRSIRRPPYAQDKVEAFCSVLSDHADTLEKRAVEAFAFCASLATDLNYPGQWTELCIGRLQRLSPEDYPAAAELTGRPALAPILDSADLATAESPGR